MSASIDEEVMAQSVPWHRKKAPLDIVWAQNELTERRHIAKHLLNPEEAWPEIKPGLTSRRLDPIRKCLYAEPSLGPNIHSLNLKKIRFSAPRLIELLDTLTKAYQSTAQEGLNAALSAPSYAYVDKSEAYPASLHLLTRQGLYIICSIAKAQADGDTRRAGLRTVFRVNPVKSLKQKAFKLSSAARAREAVRKLRDRPSKRVREYTPDTLNRFIERPHAHESVEAEGQKR